MVKSKKSECTPWHYFSDKNTGDQETIPGTQEKGRVIGRVFDRSCKTGGPEVTVTRFYNNGKITDFIFDKQTTPYAMRLFAQFKGDEKRAAALDKLAKITSLTPQERINHMAKVVFAETGGQMANAKAADPRQKFKAQYLVGSIIANRVGRKDFANPQSAYAACDDRIEFSCINSTANANWMNAGIQEKMSPEQRETWKECLKIARELEKKTFKPIHEKIVYFHATTRSKPTDWDNKFAIAKFEIEFAGHKYYSTQKQKNPVQKKQKT